MATSLAHDLDLLFADLPDLLTRRQLCELLQVNRMTLASWVRRRNFPKPLVRTPAAHRWLKTAVRRWMASSAGREAVQA
jgi:predicted DNA-binding transcriptional regulator AlpA